jgi:hypothetical protein
LARRQSTYVIISCLHVALSADPKLCTPMILASPAWLFLLVAISASSRTSTTC